MASFMEQPQVLHSTTGLVATLEGSLPPHTFSMLEAVAHRASRMSMPLYLVGGSVRDLLLGVPVKDMDLVVEGDATSLAVEVSRDLGGDVPTTHRFGTATVRPNGQRLDLATARRETYLRPGALPTVSPSSIDEDLGRRDFSVNAMAIAFSGRHQGLLLDSHGGEEDLKHGLIRVLHAGSFGDDPTRILRAIRYEQRLGFRLEERTLGLLGEAVEGSALDTVSGDRIRRELELMFHEEAPRLPLSRCGDLGILRAIHPSLKDGDGKDGDGVRALTEVLPGSHLAYLAALSLPLTPQESESFIGRLRMPGRWSTVVRDTVAVRSLCDLGTSPNVGEPGLPHSRLRDLLDGFSPVAVQVNTLLSQSAEVRSALEVYLTKLRRMKPRLDGKDLIGLGIAEGPRVGAVLKELRDAVIDGRVVTRGDEVELAKELAESAKGG